MSGNHRVPAGRFRAVYSLPDGSVTHIGVTLFDEDWRPLVLGGLGIVPAEELDKGFATFIRVEAVPR